MANLKYQFMNSIENGFGNCDNGGISKRGIKFDPNVDTKDYVFSYSEKGNLIKVASNFSDYLKANHSEIKYAKDVPKEIVKEYLQSKHKSNGGACNSNSVNMYASSLDKLSHLVNQKFKNAETDWKIPRAELPKDEEKLRELKMDEGHFKEALATLKDGTAGKFGIQLAREFALRASETVKIQVRDFDFENYVLHIVDSKGGRNRDIPLDNVQIKWLKKEFNRRGLEGKDRLVPLRDQSVSDLLAQGLKRSGHEEYLTAKTSIHSVRKMAAQSFYRRSIDGYEDRGFSFKQAEKKAYKDTSEFLGHGRDRNIGAYVERIKQRIEYEDF